MVNSGELIEAWRSDVLDDVGPYLWSRAEAIRYAEAAYRRFVRLTGGIHDFTSPLTRVDIVAGEELATVSPLILRFDKVQRESDGREIAIANWTDQGLMRRDDYGISSFLYNDRAPGEVRYMVIGSEVGKVKWVSPPAADDVALAVGDTVRMIVAQDSGGALNGGKGSNTATALTGCMSFVWLRAAP